MDADLDTLCTPCLLHSRRSFARETGQRATKSHRRRDRHPLRGPGHYRPRGYPFNRSYARCFATGGAQAVAQGSAAGPVCAGEQTLRPGGGGWQ